MRRKDGFTLIEILVVIGIMTMLAALLLGGLTAAKNKAKRTEARQVVAQIVEAWNAYYIDYRHFPNNGPGKSFNNLTSMNVDAVRILQGNYEEDGSADNKWANKNPRHTRYMDFHKYYTEQSGFTGFKDPWGNVYQISLDEDYDNQVTGNNGQKLNHIAVAWSMGPDGESGTGDDICSWDKR